MQYEHYKKLSRVALGREKAQTVFRGAQVLNVFTEQFEQADIAVQNGIIVGVGSYEGEQVIDLSGKYIVPGFIDAHIHLESTLLRPSEFVGYAAEMGTTSFVVDPHEAANVAGLDGIEYILNETEQSAANVFVMMPSCVPSVDFEENGCLLDSEKMAAYAAHPRVLGLGEVMDYLAVVNAAPQMFEKLRLFDGRVKDGHAPFLGAKELNAYALAGIGTDHECVDYDYAMQERARGMHVHIREGSAAKNLEAIVSGIVKANTDTDGFSFCTDDKHVEEILKEGHISYNIRCAIELGLNPVKAYKMASYNTALCYGLRQLGAIAPGRQADLVVLDDFEKVAVTAVYHRGKRIVREAQPLPAPCAASLRDTIRLKPFTQAELVLHVEKNPMPVIGVLEGQIITKLLFEQLPADGGIFCPDAIYSKAVVVERHKATGHIGVGPVKGFGICGGAIASSVSHDSHNIIAIGDNDRDLCLAIAELERIGGGYSAVRNGQVAGALALPVMGLMSEDGFAYVNKTFHSLLELVHQMGVPAGIEPYNLLSFLALPVIPEARITPRGMFDVKTFSLV